MVELKVFEKIRNVLIGDSTVKGYVNDRVYTTHISTVQDPTYPAISLHLMPGQARTDVPEMVNMAIQIDLWFPRDKYTVDDVLTCYQRIRELLHKQNLCDTTIGIKVQQILEASIGSMMFDQDTNGHHLPARYSVVAI